MLHTSRRGRNLNSLVVPLMSNFISPLPTSMFALAVLRKGLPSMRGAFLPSPISRIKTQRGLSVLQSSRAHFRRFPKDSERNCPLTLGTWRWAPAPVSVASRTHSWARRSHLHRYHKVLFRT